MASAYAILAQLAVGGLLFATSCGPAVQVQPSPFDEDDPRALPPSASPSSPTGDDAAESESPGDSRTILRRRHATVARSDLHAVLDSGPGSFLRGVEIAPHFRSSRFNGWKIVQFMPGEARFDAYDLRPGDIIGPVNGRLIERPPHLFALWSELRTARHITVEVTRGGDRFELQVDIVDDSGELEADGVPATAAP